jgi:hypothetical protein
MARGYSSGGVSMDVQWTVGRISAPVGKMLDNPGTYKTFSKLPLEDQEKIFNAMRAELLVAGRMEQK